MAIPTPYLQTLSPEEAIAFVTSLQKIKEHLSHELTWMNQQVEQKTIQLQGIETLLAEARTIELLATNANSHPSPATTATPSSIQQTLNHDLAATTHVVDSLETVIELNGNTAAQMPTEPQVAVQMPPEPPAAMETSAPVEEEIPQPAKEASKSRPRASKKPRAIATKKPKSTSQSQARKANQQQDLRDLLLPEFAGQSLTDVAAQLLASATQPLHINELLSEMYGSLTGEDLKRARISLANVLSTGKKKGKWQNVGNGLYQAEDA